MIENGTEGNIVCYCSGTTAEQVRDLITDGVVSIERISRITGACSGCGGCEFTVQEIIDMATAEPARRMSG
ncbi:MAG: (2Fe-2S)-binding protein [Gammaproteobacteria bacterium]